MTALASGASCAFDLIDRLAVPLILADRAGVVVHVNAAAYDLLGVGALREPIGVALGFPADLLEGVVAAADGQRIRGRVLARAVASGHTVAMDALLSRYDVAEPDGTVESLVLIEGVLESAAHREIQRLTEQLVALSFGYPDMRFEVTPKGDILDFAVADPTALNIPPERLLEPTIQSALPHPAGEELGVAVAKFVDARGASDLIDTLCFQLDGPAGEKHFEARLISLDGDQRVLITMRNITDRVMAERDAARTRDRLVEALESIDQGFVLYDRDDRLVLANSRYRSLMGVDDSLVRPGVTFEEVLRNASIHGVYGIPAEELEAWIADRRAYHETGGPPRDRALPDGRWLRIEERVTRSGDRVGLRTDISESKRREEELGEARRIAENADKQKTGFVHHLSHELRTPLNAVLGFAHMIADELLGPCGNDRYPVYARQIAEAGGYMLELINNLLDLAKIEAGHLRLHEEPCDLPALVDLTLSMVAGRAQAANVALADAIPDDIPPVFGDCSLVRQMLTNLISNAIKFCPQDGRGSVEVGAALNDDSGLSLYVRDNGKGMSPDQIPRALSPFEQAHDRTKTLEVGTGLGLPLTRALIELHGGRFDIQSAVNQGTVVYLTFPPHRVMPRRVAS